MDNFAEGSKIIVMEPQLKIKTPDKHIIYGTFRPARRKSSALLIFVHGLHGHQNGHIFYNGARYFSERGVNTFRFDLYTGEKGGRVLTKCGISTHAKDLDTVVKHFRKKYKKIFVAGHSLGAPTIFYSDTGKVDGIIFWDGSRPYSWRLKYIKSINAYLAKSGTEYLVGKKMYEERKNFPAKESLKKINKPIKIIVAGKGQLIQTGKQYFKYANKPKEFAIIKGATHNFNEEGTAEKLFQETYSFIRRFT